MHPETIGIARSTVARTWTWRAERGWTHALAEPGRPTPIVMQRVGKVIQWVLSVLKGRPPYSMRASRNHGEVGVRAGLRERPVSRPFVNSIVASSVRNAFLVSFCPWMTRSFMRI